MKRFIKLYYLPGAGGNFLSRCINLLDDTYGWCNGETLPKTLEEKYNLLTYKNIESLHFYKKVKGLSEWLRFEASIKHYQYTHPHWDIGPNSNAIEIMHPTDSNFNNITTVGKDDRLVQIYVDCTNNWDWIVINCWKKNQFETIFIWTLLGEEIRKNPSVYKFNLANMIDGYEKFLLEFTKLATFIDRKLTPDIEIVLHKLYDEWQKTTVHGDTLKNIRSDYANIIKQISNDFERNLK